MLWSMFRSSGKNLLPFQLCLHAEIASVVRSRFRLWDCVQCSRRQALFGIVFVVVNVALVVTDILAVMVQVGSVLVDVMLVMADIALVPVDIAIVLMNFLSFPGDPGLILRQIGGVVVLQIVAILCLRAVELPLFFCAVATIPIDIAGIAMDIAPIRIDVAFIAVDIATIVIQIAPVVP